ncbi:DUF397 domain-containing protein [Streptomyces pluripotens]|uniref:DUF397 domain-containing protein n=1 Tax=Streptomyces pluripotens TaxID=1355015 RepID=A0A221P0T7_9ACTN|nr:DUF397 domain-containing protein [Streptomyces pluripotens]ASN25847.1 DUF397 domain-containing protein [Streptomyces pluripotens]MCH0557521.1 DUF397 domain-containing protein [Streptomyces sp. MUM 16J]
MEVALHPTVPTPTTVHIRDSKQAGGGPVLTVAPATWTDFVRYAVAGH